MKLYILLLAQIGFSHGKIFYMDDICGLAPWQPVMDILVGPTGLNSTGILRAAHYPPSTRQILAEMGVLNSTILIRTENFLASSPSGMNCSVRLVPPKGYGIVLSIRFLNFRNALCTDYLKFSTNHTSFLECGTPVDDDSESKSYAFGETVMVTFHTEYRYHSDVISGFDLTFTAVGHTTSGVCFGNDTFLCDNRNCIWNGLTCNGHNNCGDLSDENPYGETNCGYRRNDFQYFGVFVSLFMLILITSASCFYCCRHRRILVYSGTVVHSPLATASTGSVNYGTYSIMPYAGQQLGTSGLMGQNAYTYPMPPSQPAPYPPFGTTGSTGPVASPQPAPYPPSDTSGRPLSPPPPYTQKSSPK